MKKAWLFLIILAVFLYFIFPYDLIPDFFGLFGRLDDFALLGWLFWFVRRQLAKREKVNPQFHQQSYTKSSYRDTKTEENRNRYDNNYEKSNTYNKEKTESSTVNEDDPYSVLNVKPGATEEEIKKAYKETIKKYHPDKVAHLGEEFQKIAHKKMIIIQKAYEILMKR